MRRPNVLWTLYSVLYSLGLLCAAPVFAARILLARKYRRSSLQKLGLAPFPATSPDGPRPVWVHALSVGEVLSAVPLVRSLRLAFPDVPVVISTATETGWETARRELSDLTAHIFFAPLDFPPAVSRCVSSLRPRLFVLVETDIWPSLLRALHRNGVPSVLVNARISERSFRGYRLLRFFLRDALRLFSFIGVQAPVYANRMIALGASFEKVRVLGNLKADAVEITVGQEDRNAMIRSCGWEPGSVRILVAGSTHEGEEEILLRVFRTLWEHDQALRLVIVPRDIERSNAVCILASTMDFFCRALSDPPDAKSQVVVVNALGTLARLYAVGEAAFVGGSLVKQGGHNPLEPAAHGVPVFFGPHMDDFPEIARLLTETGGAVRVKDGDGLYNALLKGVRRPHTFRAMGIHAREASELSRGAVEKYMSVLKEIAGLPDGRS